MIDFHSHILPKLDDGSRSLKESLSMLQYSYKSGVRTMVATPHYYASKEDPSHFLKRRSASYKHLIANLEGTLPQIRLGAEVYYYQGISNCEMLNELCIQGTNVLMLEMPFRKWSQREIDEVIYLTNQLEITVLLAHIDRYLKFNPANLWTSLRDEGILFQVNAEAFLNGWFMRRSVMKLLKQDYISALGSDCHNMENRRPNMKEAMLLIRDKAGDKELKRLEAKSRQLLG